MTFKCPKCGTDSGYYTLARATLKTFYDPNGEAFDSDVIRYAQSAGQKFMCWDCDAVITAYVKKYQAEL